MKRWTTRQVARLAGVSPATVSRVLNNQSCVSPELAERVRAAIRLLESGAAGGGAGTPRRIGVALPRRIAAHEPEPVGGAFYGPVLAGVEEVVRAAGHDLSLFTYDPADVAALADARPRLAGLILMGADTPDEFARRVAAEGLPVVVVDKQVRGVDSVVSDNAGGAEEITAHVIQAGYPSLVYLCETLADPSFAARFEGFRRAVRAAGAPLQVRHVEVGRGWMDAPAFVAGICDAGQFPLAVVAGNDMTALHILALVRTRGLQVPDQVGIAGFDDIALASHSEPGLTTVRVDKVEMGRLAARRLLDRLQEPDLLPVTITMHVALVVRGSTALGGPRSRPQA